MLAGGVLGLAILAKHSSVLWGGALAFGIGTALVATLGDPEWIEAVFGVEPDGGSGALEWGLVNRVVPREELDDTVDALARALTEKLPEVVRYTKQQLNFWRDLSWHLTIGHARDWLTLHADSAEVREGIEAFHEKRPVRYEMFRSGIAESRGRQRANAPARGSPHRDPELVFR